jgi:lipopolysaccharide transport system permease protein
MENRFGNQTVIIDSAAGNRGWGLKEILNNREIAYFIFWREIKVRYKQAVLGIAWAILRPVMNMVVFSTIFGTLAKLPSDGIPYPVFAYCAILPWQLFSQSVSSTTVSLIANRTLIDKIYFPRMIFPVASVFSGLFDFMVAFTVLVLMMVYYGIMPTVNALFLPFLILLACGNALSVGLWLGALSVQYRDFKQILPFMIQFWFYATPVVYSSSLIPDNLQAWYSLNPMVGVVEGFRWALLGQSEFQILPTIYSILFASGSLLIGVKFFQKMDRTLADVI